ncbi:MAG: quinolinate synthase NadA [Epulopiscium sp.]|nr:quinolinate synthase NadA [Candidatus Epulonipiscium sp.]
MINYKEEIIRLKEEKNIVILAHYYMRDEIQELADYIGDSYYLSKIGLDVPHDIIAFCGVHFMAESAKILSPHKKVLLPNMNATCSMVEMATKKEVLKLKEKYKDAKIVSYVNSSTEVKSISDACCTSSNAYDVIQNIDAEEIIFVPDQHLGSYIQEKVDHKRIILWNGFCCVHHNIRAKDVLHYKEKANQELQILVHPECRAEVRDLADFVGSTGQMIQYVGQRNEKDFLVVTEEGIFYELKNKYPDRRFHSLNILCGPMKCITLQDLYECLLYEKNEIILEESLREKAEKSLVNMLTLSEKK